MAAAVESRDERETLALDYDFHGRIGVRLINASAADRSAVMRQLGTVQQKKLRRPPDLQIRFVRRLPAEDLQFLGPRTGFNQDSFFLFSRGRVRKACVPFDRLGAPCEIIVETGMQSIPLLIDALKLTALRQGLLPLHASAFEYRGAGVVVLGWPHSGKTAALLAMMQRGGTFISDDLVLLDPERQMMYGIAAPVEVSDWQIRQMPDHGHRVPPTSRLAWRAAAGIARHAAAARWSATVAGKALNAIQRQLRTSIPAESIDPAAGGRVASVRIALFTTIHDAGDVALGRAESSAFIERAVCLALHDRLSLRGAYLAYRVAFPSRRNDLLDSLDEVERDLTRRALSGLECWFLRHPRPVQFADLQRALEPAFAGRHELAVQGVT